MLRLITFDATNTLFKVRDSVGELYARAAFVHGINADPEKIEANFGKSFNQFNKIYPNFGQAAGISSRQWWDLVVKGSFNGHLVMPATLEKISSDLFFDFKSSSCWDVYPDVVPALKEFTDNGVRLGVISNFDERLSRILEELDLTKFFSFIVASRETGFYKPSPDIFTYALQQVNVCPTEAAHVGDNLKLDYIPAQQAGMDAYMLLRQPTETNPNLLLVNKVPKEKIINNLQMLWKQIIPKP